jgi:hypothetical protein
LLEGVPAAFFAGGADKIQVEPRSDPAQSISDAVREADQILI